MSLDLSQLNEVLEKNRPKPKPVWHKIPGILGSLALLSLFMPFVLETCNNSTLEIYRPIDIVNRETPEAGWGHAFIVVLLLGLSLGIWAWYLLPNSWKTWAPILSGGLGLCLTITFWLSIALRPEPWLKSKEPNAPESSEMEFKHKIEAGFGLMANLVCHACYLGFGLWLIREEKIRKKQNPTQE